MMLTPSLRSISLNSLLLCTRTSIMLYPLLLVVLLLSVTASTLQASLGWWATPEGWGLLVSIALVILAVFAGWLGMAHNACNTWALLHAVWPNTTLPRLAQAYKTPPPTLPSGDAFIPSASVPSPYPPLPKEALGPISTLQAFSLFKAFVPAVGQYFCPLLIGVLVYAASFVALVWGVEQLGMALFGEPSATLLAWLKLLNEAPLTPDVAERFTAGFEALAYADKLWLARWNLLILIGTGLYAFGVMLTLLTWPLRILWPKPLGWCFWQALKQPIIDPWGFFVATTLLTALDALLLLAALLAGSLPWVSALCQVLWLVSLIYRTYWLLFYVILRIGSPHLFWLEADKEATA